MTLLNRIRKFFGRTPILEADFEEEDPFSSIWPTCWLQFPICEEGKHASCPHYMHMEPRGDAICTCACHDDNDAMPELMMLPKELTRHSLGNDRNDRSNDH